MEQEIWKPVVGFEGLYEVSNMGRVKSLARKASHVYGQRTVNERILKPNISRHGYCCVTLYLNGKKRAVRVHRLVLNAFVPNEENKRCIDHINTIKTDNRLSNLRWVTHKENTENPLTVANYKRTHDEKWKEKMFDFKLRKGSINNKNVFQYTKDGKFIAKYRSLHDAERFIGKRGSRRNISKVLDSPQFSAYGYMWKTNKTEPTQ